MICRLRIVLSLVFAIFLNPFARGAATFEVLKNFAVPGRNPSAKLVSDNEGNLYGTADGGANFWGIVFKVSPSGKVETFHDATTMHPIHDLVYGSDGWLYGTSGGGAISRLSKEGEYEHLYDFAAAGISQSQGALLEVAPGDFYGTTLRGGQFNYGVVYRFRAGSGLTILHHFQGENAGAPTGSLVLGNDGKLYGVTNRGLYRVSTTGEFESLFRFPFSNEPPAYPMGTDAEGELVLATDGKFYGVTTNGGNNGHGTIFSLSDDGNVEVLHHFESTSLANGGLIEGHDGWLYGTRWHPGSLYRVSKQGVYETLQEFSMDENAPVVGFTPFVGVTRVGEAYYGTTGLGGVDGGGTVFKYSASEGFQTLHQFGTGDGYGASSRFHAAADGYLYAARDDGGSKGHGAILRVSPTGDAEFWHGFSREVPLTFTDQESRRLGVVENGGAIYSVTSLSGSMGGVRISKTTPDGIETLVRNFGNGEVPRPASGLIRKHDGQLYVIAITQFGKSLARLESNGDLTPLSEIFPFDVGQIVEGPDNAFYGAGNSGIVRITPDGNFTTLHSFASDEYFPGAAELCLDSNGVFYGFTVYPGTTTIRRFFSIQPAGSFMSIREYGPDGLWHMPLGLVHGSDGNFYGPSFGHVVRITPKGEISSIQALPTIGSQGLTQGNDGIYGLTRTGGPGGGGQLFRIKLTTSAPVAQDDVAFVRLGEEVLVPVLANDSDEDAQELSVSAQTAAFGTVQVVEGGIRYVPGPKFSSEDSFTYEISDGYGGTATATVRVRNPFVADGGSFETVLADANGAYAGKLQVNVSRFGNVSGFVILNGVRRVMKGKMNIEGELTMTVTRGAQPPLIIELKLDHGTAPAVLSSVVREGTAEPSEYNGLSVAGRAGSVSGELTPGRWTLHFSAPSVIGLPQGFGWASVNAKRSGALTIAGKLADGTTLSIGTHVLRGGTALVQQSFRRAAGEIFGQLDLLPEESAESNGSLRWRKAPAASAPYPDGFQTEVQTHLATYTKPSARERVLSYVEPVLDMVFEGAGFASIGAAMNISLADVATPLPSNAVKSRLSISRSSGKFSGSLLTAGAKQPIKFTGVFDKSLNRGFGFFVTDQKSGAVTLTPR